ncbi:MAG: coproporphyrinogen-III oxidase family protein [Pirellulales bacterium]
MGTTSSITANDRDLATCAGDEPELGKYFICAYPPFPYWKPEFVGAARRTVDAASPRSPVALGLYIHVPFCVRRCDYCYYRSFAESTHDDRQTYLDYLDRELAIYGDAPVVRGRRVSFAYIGGGTPSLLTAIQIRTLLESVRRHFAWNDVEEVTFECAPDSVQQDKLRELLRGGVTRVSLGVQQFDDDVLAANGRVHRVRSIERAYRAIRDYGFTTVNIDLMVGLVGESDATFRHSVERAMELGADSVTVYQLEIPNNTPLFRRLQHDRTGVELAPWDVKHDRLAAAMERLTESGYTLRSAYAAVRDPVRDQFLYQDAQYRGADLLGLGVASFSYVGGVHYQNAATLEEYYGSLARGELPIQRAYPLTLEEQMVREFVLQLKLVHVSRDYFRRKFGVDVVQRFAPAMRQFQSQGLLTWDDRTLSLTKAGLPRVDRMIRVLRLPAHAE